MSVSLSRHMMGQYVTLHGEVISHVNLSRTEVGDGGLYTCTATNRAGSAAHSARLNIYGECRHYWSLVTCVLQFHQYLQLGWARLNPPRLGSKWGKRGSGLHDFKNIFSKITQPRGPLTPLQLMLKEG